MRPLQEGDPGDRSETEPLSALGGLRTTITQCSFETPENLCPIAQGKVSSSECFCLKGIIEKDTSGKYRAIETIHQGCGGQLNTVLKFSQDPQTGKWQFQNTGSYCEKCQLKVSWP